jgi:hypothetical protein
VSRDGNERIERAPEVEEIARRLGSCNRLKRVSRWYSSVLKGMEGAKNCFASSGEILAEGVDSKMRRCLFCFFSEMKDSDWFIPVAMIPFHQYWEAAGIPLRSQPRSSERLRQNPEHTQTQLLLLL